MRKQGDTISRTLVVVAAVVVVEAEVVVVVHTPSFPQVFLFFQTAWCLSLGNTSRTTRGEGRWRYK